MYTVNDLLNFARSVELSALRRDQEVENNIKEKIDEIYKCAARFNGCMTTELEGRPDALLGEEGNTAFEQLFSLAGIPLRIPERPRHLRLSFCHLRD
jgi:hypothetical protein